MRAFEASDPDEDPVESARRLMVRAWQSYAASRKEQRATGWRLHAGTPSRRTTPVAEWRDLRRLAQVRARLRNVALECDDGLEVIRRLDRPGILFYCDPPYLDRTRCARWHGKGYHHEFADEQDHLALAEVLCGCKGMVVLSSYPDPLYADLYGGSGWMVIERESHTGKPGVFRKEQLWLNPAAAGAHRQAVLPGMTNVGSL